MTQTYKLVTEYDSTTGRITQLGKFGLSAEPQPGHSFVDGHADIYSDYIDTATATVQQRQPLGATLSADSIALGESVTLSPLPIPCTVSVQGAPVAVDDGVLEITPQSVGDAYQIMVDELEYLRETWYFEVTANEV